MNPQPRPTAGEIWLTDFGDPYPGEPAYRHPALILARPLGFPQKTPTVVLIPITTSYRDMPTHIEIDPTPETGLDEPSYAQCELLGAAAVSRLLHRLGEVGPDILWQAREIGAAMLYDD